MERTNIEIRSLDGIRGIAALLVAVYHFTLHSDFSRSFYLVVDLFFILSGYVMIRSYSNRLSSRIELANFMFRRFGRLYPVHLAMLILVVLSANALEYLKIVARPLGLGGLLNSPVVHLGFPGAHAIAANLLLLQGFGPVSQSWDINHPSWSISVEFYTYLIFALAMLWLAAKWRKAAFVALGASGMVFTVCWSIIGQHCLSDGECMNVFDGLSIFRCIGGFFIGVLIFEFDTVRWMKSAIWASACQIASLLLMLLIMAGSGPLPALALFSNIAFAGLILSLQTDRGPVAYLLNRPAIQYLGKLSYSIYMCHWSFLMMSDIMHKPVSPALKLAVLCAYLLIMLAVAALTYVLIEQPFRLATRRAAKRFFVDPAQSRAGEASSGV